MHRPFTVTAKALVSDEHSTSQINNKDRVLIDLSIKKSPHVNLMCHQIEVSINLATLAEVAQSARLGADFNTRARLVIKYHQYYA